MKTSMKSPILGGKQINAGAAPNAASAKAHKAINDWAAGKISAATRDAIRAKAKKGAR